MNLSKIMYLVISDIHLGHKRTPTEYIIANLLTLFKDNHRLFKKLDIIFLDGDVFDSLLTTNSKEYIQALEWLSLLAMYSAKYKIKLRFVEGTNSHDWRQLAAFIKTLETLNIDLDYKYFDTLSIEYMDDLGISILYVPDECNHDARDTYVEVKELLAKYNMDKVDIAMMHGQFHYQLPMIELPSSHNEEDYLSIVKYYINIGHIHISSVYDRILAQGSFDRLAHNEEGDKGCMVMTIYHNGDMDFTRIINKNAYPYKKYDVSELNASDVIKYLEKEFKKLKLGTRVKVIVSNKEVSRLLKPLQDKFKDLFFTVDKKKDKTVTVIENNRVVIDPFEITKDNLEGLLLKELDKHNLSKGDIDIIIEEISEVK